MESIGLNEIVGTDGSRSTTGPDAGKLNIVTLADLIIHNHGDVQVDSLNTWLFLRQLATEVFL